MTVIAWDGRTLAADRRAAVNSDMHRLTRKICVIGDMLVAYSGTVSTGEELVQWLRDGAVPAAFPASARGDDAWARMMVVTEDRCILLYEGGPHPSRFLPQQFAIGSGAAYAMAAMHCGRNAVQAVEVASLFDPGCGGGVDAADHARLIVETVSL